MYSIGIDIGSVGTKAILFNGEVVDRVIMSTGWSPKLAGKQAFEQLLVNNNLKREDVKQAVVTGYGRISIDFADKVVTEITCHAKGAYFLNNEVRTIIDIGGQDSKAVSLDSSGNVVDFIMNDKCAAGTGKFLEVTINSLGADIGDIDKITKGAKAEKINSMCTVFAESEVVSLLAKGAAKESIALGIIHSIATRITSLLGKIEINDKILFTGGLANSKRISKELSVCLGKDIYRSEYSQLAGALGAAIIGWDRISERVDK
ncbi:acyl-CoA dehydratase activase [Halocella sp. SP3-1]|uniref:acyl-CoA dehydratase activase n=1 Tax=Halocella sp. SP3-1 TaxID=2382161 RepID=UPI000F75B0B0|nr:acyl-CoA dehydratase activase [Halocella sp. SP3-1]AZO94729.1 2-hydroxyglutaryl-CoA dehydratase [Halocella sp. SP3-1]